MRHTRRHDFEMVSFLQLQNSLIINIQNEMFIN